MSLNWTVQTYELPLSSSPVFYLLLHHVSSQQGKRIKLSTNRNNDLPHFEPPPITPKTPISFNFNIKGLRSLGGNTISQRSGQAPNSSQHLSLYYPMHSRRPSNNINAIEHLSPNYYPTRCAVSLTSMEADRPHIQQLQAAQEELARERQNQASHAGYFNSEEIPHQETKRSVGGNGIDDQQQKWVIKPYITPEIPGQIKKHRYEEPVESLASRRKHDYNESMELW
ncbi:hypothetical protein ACMFMF_009530 [Clarireedia jacksonii]